MDITGIIIAVGAVAIGMALLCVGVIFRKDHSFRSQHIHQNERMRKDKIHCALSEDKISRKHANGKLKIEN